MLRNALGHAILRGFVLGIPDREPGSNPPGPLTLDYIPKER